MDGLHGTDACFSPGRSMSPQVRPHAGPPDVGGQYLAELLQERQKLGPFMQVLPVCSRLLSQEIMLVSGMLRQHGVGDFERLPVASPNQMHPSSPMPNFCGNGFGPWSGMHPEQTAISPSSDLNPYGYPITLATPSNASTCVNNKISAL